MERVEVDGEVFLFPRDNPITVGGTDTVTESKTNSTKQPDAIVIDDEPGPSTGRGFFIAQFSKNV